MPTYPWLENINPKNNQTGFSQTRFYWAPQRKEKQFLFFVVNRFMGANPQITFPEVVDMAFCALFFQNPECKKLFDADLIRFQPNFFAANTATLDEMQEFIRDYEQSLKE